MIGTLSMMLPTSSGITLRKPPLGFSSWNCFHMGVSAPLLLDTADAMNVTGLQASGYVYINTDDGWLDKNRTNGGQAGLLKPSAHFTNETDGIKALTGALATKGFKFGIYLAAGESTCGNRAGSLYHEAADARQIAAAGIKYLKYDDCGEANIQSYAKYSVMQDALNKAYAHLGGIDYYSYEPFQVYNPTAVSEMSWTALVGDLWRTGGDIRPLWESIMNNAYANNRWAVNAKPGHYNDADMLEVGNGALTLAEQRSHFALWCVMKSPLIIGTDIRMLSPDSLAILKNERLIAINQDDLGVQGTLRTATDYGRAWTHVPFVTPQLKTTIPTTPTPTAPTKTKTKPRTTMQGSPFVGRCSFGKPAPQQKFRLLHVAGTNYHTLLSEDRRMCLTILGRRVSIEECGGAGQIINFGRANETVAQIRDKDNSSSCLTYSGSSLHMEQCRTEVGDGRTDENCWLSNCRFSSLSDQLFYLNALGQLSLGFTNFQVPHGAPPRRFPMATNIPMCIMQAGGSQPGPTSIPEPPKVNISLPLQVWAGPLAGGDVVVLLLNTGSRTAKITALWNSVGIGTPPVTAVNLWTGSVAKIDMTGISSIVGAHDVAVFRVTPSAAL